LHKEVRTSFSFIEEKTKAQRGEALTLGYTAGNWQSCEEENSTPKLRVWEVYGNKKHTFLGLVSDYKISSLVLG
jgi:hypothetical protein